MAKVIQIKLGSKNVYHVSWNPNNGVVTTTENINEAAVFKKTKADTKFAKGTIDCIRQSYRSFKLQLVKLENNKNIHGKEN